MSQIKVIGLKRTRKGDLNLFGDREVQTSFEQYLLEFEVKGFQKLLARFGSRAHIGHFKAEKPGYNFEHYYLCWCMVHLIYFVTYYRGNEKRLDCPACSDEFLMGIKQTMPKAIEDKKETKLKLVKSDRD